MTVEKKGILPVAAILPALVAMHKAVTGAELKPGDNFAFTMRGITGNLDTAGKVEDCIAVTAETIQIANVIFMQYGNMAKLMASQMKGK